MSKNNKVYTVVENIYDILGAISRITEEDGIDNEAFIINELSECEFLLKDLQSNMKNKSYYGDFDNEYQQDLTEQLII